MELSDYGLTGQATTVEEPNQKYHNHPLPRSKEHEYMAPEFKHEPNTFIMNLMEQPVMFSKTMTHDGTTSTASTFGMKDALSPDIQFSNSIFHIVHKQGELPLNATSAGAVYVSAPNVTLDTSQNHTQSTQQAAPTTPPPTTLHDNGAGHFTHKTDNFMTINDDYLTPTVTNSVVPAVQETVSQFPTLSLLAGSSVVGLENAGHVMYTHCNARKVLPHKKRISRKIKAEEEKLSDATTLMPVMTLDEQHNKVHVNNEIEEQIQQQQQQEEQQQQQHSRLKYEFNCEICGHGTSLQLEFFQHLKQHYEPTTNDTLIHAMDKNTHTVCEMNVRERVVPEEEIEVFPDVHLNFADFQHVATPTQHKHEQEQQHQLGNEAVAESAQVSEEDMKILNSNSIDKCINYVTQADNSPLKNLVVDEFSDTEDMLEGIRNVVVKVSIEDTCDEHELMDAHDMRTPWFSSNNFSDIAFKSKSFADVSLAQILVDTASNDVHEKVNAQVGVGVEHEERNLVDAMAVSSALNSTVVLNLPSGSDMDLTAPHLDADLEKDINSMYHIEAEQDMVERPLMRLASIKSVNNIRNLCHSEKTDENLKDNNERQHDDEEGEYNAIDEELVLDDKRKPIVKMQNKKKGEERIKTSKKLKKQHICTQCNREFNSGNALKYHRRTHLNLRPHSCNICERTFYALSALKSHLLIHANNKPFECEHCHRKFRQYADLNYHIVSIHTTIKSFVCEFCGKSFSRKYSLMLHVTIHTSVRNYKCDICGKTFRASSYLMNHRKIHTGEKPYECSVCGKRFRMSGDMRRHMSVHERTKRQKKTVAEAKAEC